MKLITGKFDNLWVDRCDADFDLVMTVFPRAYQIKHSHYFGDLSYYSRQRCLYYSLPKTVESNYDYCLRQNYEIDKE